MKAKGRSKELSERTFGMLSQLPIFLFLIVVVFFPLAYSFNLSLFQNNLRRPSENAFIGLTNYYEVVTSPLFSLVVRNTVIFALGSIGGILLVALGAALLLNEQFVGRGLARSLLLLPWAIPAIVNGLMWKWIFHSDFGVLNWVLRSVGLIQQNVGWLTDKSIAMVSVLIAHVWKEFPWATLLILAGLAVIPKDLIDAAKVDGANAWHRFRYITIPLTKPIIILVLIFETMWSLRAFDVIYAITRGGPSASTTTLGYWLYEVAFRQMNMGEGAALSYIMGIVIVIVAFLYIRALYREVSY